MPISEPSLQTRPSRFPDLRSAGRDLAVALKRRHEISHTIVLGIVSGGVPVADEVAKRLNLPFDLVLKRTLLAPRGPGTQLSAVCVAGSLVLPEELPLRAPVPTKPFDYFFADALDALAQRDRTCRGDRVALDLRGKNIILVDCGIRTGLTMQPVIVALKTRSAARITVAVPVGSPEGCASITPMIDELVCLAQPEPFGHVGMWYKDFSRPDDEHIHELLEPF